MSDEPEVCDHSWGDAEMCETPLGNISSPVCRHCGAVKLVEDRRRSIPRPLRPVSIPPPAPIPPAIITNAPPAGVKVHPFQLEFFGHV